MSDEDYGAPEEQENLAEGRGISSDEWVLNCVEYMKELCVYSASVPLREISLYTEFSDDDEDDFIQCVSDALDKAVKDDEASNSRWLASVLKIGEEPHLVISRVAVSALPSTKREESPARFGNIFSGADKYCLLTMPVGCKKTICRPNPDFDLSMVKNALIGSINYYNKKLQSYGFKPLGFNVKHEKDRVGVSRITYRRIA